MIKTVVHKGLSSFIYEAESAGLPELDLDKLVRQLRQLNQAECARHMALPGWELRSFVGRNRQELWAVKVSNYLLVFGFEDTNVVDVDLIPNLVVVIDNPPDLKCVDPISERLLPQSENGNGAI